MRTAFILALFGVAGTTAWADISGTITLTPGQAFSFDSGTVVTSGSDITFQGTTITLQGTATAAVVSVDASGTIYSNLNAATLPVFSYSATPIVSSFLVVNDVIAIHTNGAHYAKLRFTAASSASIAFQYTTYGATGSGGGNGGTGGGSAPLIGAIENNYGAIQPGLPNYGIAPGSIFVLVGTGLAGTTTSLQSSAAPGLQTTLNNVTLSVTVGATTVNCPIYYLSPTQIDAVLPGNTPVGSGTIVVNNNGNKSLAAPILVVQSAFGILTYNLTLAATYDAQNFLVTSTNAANPGQVIVIYGSGVGADPQNDDKVFPQNQNNLTGIPVQAFVGGVPATILYRGRSQFPGLDQINLTIPAGVPPGCFVSLSIFSGTRAIASNGTTIPVAASGKTCSEPNSIASPDVLSALTPLNTVRSGTVFESQIIDLSATTITNNFGAIFNGLTAPNFLAQEGTDQLSVGSCLVLSNAGQFGTLGLVDAGTIKVTGPQGALTLVPTGIQGIYYQGPNVPANFIPASSSQFVFNNGPGGTNVGPFNVAVTTPGNFTWTNPSVAVAIDRTKGLTVTWTGGAPGVVISIVGVSIATVNNQLLSATFSCGSPLSAGQFTVPVQVLQAMPPGTGTLTLSVAGTLELFKATGLDIGYASSATVVKTNATFE